LRIKVDGSWHGAVRTRRSGVRHPDGRQVGRCGFAATARRNRVGGRVV